MDSLDTYEVQIIYTKIDSTKAGYTFTDFTFQEDSNNYFYPASTVKFPMALLAAEYAAQHPELTIDTPYSIEKDSVLHTIADDISQIFAVSDNQAYNRLYELLGRDYATNRLVELGLKNSRISHRLSTRDAAENTRRKVQLYPSYEGPIFQPKIADDKDITPLKEKNTYKGKGFMKDGKLVSTPMDFTLKNAFALKDQHQLTKQFFFPDEFRDSNSIHLRPSEEIRIKKMMATLPRNAGYDAETYDDSYGKFFMYGDSKDSIPPHIKI
jgi:cell division protein FtsI/penicillin-binding protein 2